MTKEEADIIFDSWKEYMESAEKFMALGITPPQSFLPYPIETLNVALNMVAEEYFNIGDKKMVENIHETMGNHLSSYFLSFAEGKAVSLDGPKTDEEMLVEMKERLEQLLENNDLKNMRLRKLKDTQDYWMRFRNEGKPKSY